jgi:hypothetical protein
MVIGKLQLLFFAALLGVFIISSAAHSMVERSAAALDRDTRERIWQRLIQGLWWWRAPDIAGVTLMIAGVLRTFGLLPAIAGVAWGMPSMAIGLALVSIASSIRAWMESAAYSHAAPDNQASRSARNAAFVVTAAELCLASVVCWFVFTHATIFTGPARSSGTGPSRSGSAAQGKETQGKETPGSEPPAAEPLWVDQTEAVKLLKGKDAAYVDALAARKDIRSKVENGRKLYHRGDIVEMKRAGLPSMEELQEDVKAR